MVSPARSGHTFGGGEVGFGRICRLQKAAEMSLIEKVRFCNIALTPSHGVDILVKTAPDRELRALRPLLLLSMPSILALQPLALR